MKLLVVDDSSFTRKVITQYLKVNFPKSDIITAKDGSDGYEAFLKHNPTVVITDLLMPVMEGKALIKKIRDINPKHNIIVVTADIQEATHRELTEFKNIKLINKPLTSIKLQLLESLIKEFDYVK